LPVDGKPKVKVSVSQGGVRDQVGGRRLFWVSGRRRLQAFAESKEGRKEVRKLAFVLVELSLFPFEDLNPYV
jgi:hypothetical protein